MVQLVYVLKESDKSCAHERALLDISSAGFHVDMSMVYVEVSDGIVCAGLRTVFEMLLQRLQPGDMITVQLLALGNSVAEVVAMLRRLRRERVSVICLACGNVDLCLESGQDIVRAFTVADDLERLVRRHRARAAAKSARERGISQGRPQSLSEAQQREVLTALSSGASVTEIAKSVRTSRQTVMRMRSAHAVRIGADPRPLSPPQTRVHPEGQNDPGETL